MLCVVLLSPLLLLAVACGGNSAGDKKQEALSQAAKACKGALTLAQEGEGLPQMADRLEKDADVAARAAVDDATWDDLATAISDLATADRKTGEMAKRGLDDASLSEMQGNLDAMNDAKKDVLAGCRKVKAAGGAVDQGLLDDFIR